MLVKFKRPFFDGATLHPKGTAEYNGDPANLPSDAVVLDKDGYIPVMENTPKAGFGAKPAEEQVLDLIPGAGKTHMVDPVAASAPTLTSSEKLAKELENAENEAKTSETETKAEKKALDDEKKDVAEGVKNAEKAAEKVKEITDPLASLTTKK